MNISEIEELSRLLGFFDKAEGNDMNYLDDSSHKHWLQHYASKYRDCYSLVFTTEFKEKCLPPDSTHDGFNVYLLDTTDNKVYKTRLYVAYEKEKTIVLDKDYDPVEAESLMGYFYGSHHCPCHRKHDAKKAGAIVEDDECEGSRFLIQSITCDNLPDLILYSETITEEELEERLNYVE